MRKFITNPLSLLVLGIIAFVLFFFGSVLPGDFTLSVVLRYLGVSLLIAAILPCQAWIVWRVRAVYKHIKGVPDDLDPASRARLTGFLYLALALCNVAAAIISSP